MVINNVFSITFLKFPLKEKTQANTIKNNKKKDTKYLIDYHAQGQVAPLKYQKYLKCDILDDTPKYDFLNMYLSLQQTQYCEESVLLAAEPQFNRLVKFFFVLFLGVEQTYLMVSNKDTHFKFTLQAFPSPNSFFPQVKALQCKYVPYKENYPESFILHSRKQDRKINIPIPI